MQMNELDDNLKIMPGGNKMNLMKLQKIIWRTRRQIKTNRNFFKIWLVIQIL